MNDSLISVSIWYTILSYLQSFNVKIMWRKIWLLKIIYILYTYLLFNNIIYDYR